MLEHPAHSQAFKWFGLKAPEQGKGWQKADDFGLMACYVEQGHYGHDSRKPTWLLAKSGHLPELIWSKGEQRIPEWMVERYGYEKARRIGVVAMVGGKDKERIRDRTPLPFRDVMVSIAAAAAERITA